MTDDLFGESPFYQENLPLADPTVVQATASGPRVDQKTLEEWYYQLDRIVLDCREGNYTYRTSEELEDIANDIQSYLKG